MKITIEFNSWEELEAFRGAVVEQPKKAEPAKKKQEPEQPLAPAFQAPPLQPQQGFTPAPTAQQGFPMAQPPAPQSAAPVVQQAPVNPLAQAIAAKVDELINVHKQDPQGIIDWFRSQCGVGAEQAELPALTGIFIPKLPEPHLRQICNVLGIRNV